MKIGEHIFIVLFLFLISLGGCSTSKPYSAKPNLIRYPEASSSSRYKQESVIDALYKQLHEWEGVKYKVGGLNKSGIDCSGFVHMTYKKQFGLDIPRTTEALSRYGSAVSMGNFRAGDLVFFKTGRFKRHVGIYVEKNRFIHSSTSNGVMISDIGDSYWAKHYWQSRRVLHF